MTSPNDPRRDPSDEDAARLLEAGLDPASGRRAPLPPSPEEVAPFFPSLEILEVLGQGGMGVVYKARQKALDRIVALKILPESLSKDPAFAERFTREARMLAKLQHPHIVLVYEYGESDGHHYLLMEYVDGVNLRQLMDTQSLTPQEALAIVPQVCDALQYAHDQGVVHRDIKPENVLLDRTGRVKVADFGLGKLMDRGAADFTLTGTGQVMGTLHYMAPEQYRSPQDVDHRADIFSLGVVFYEMLTGDLPVGRFAKPSESTTLDARIDHIVLKALERERELRYQHAQDVKAEVTTMGAHPPAAPEHAFGQRHAARQKARAAKPDGRRFSRWAIVAAVSIPVVVLVAFALASFVGALRVGDETQDRLHAIAMGYVTSIYGFMGSAVLSIVAVVVTSIYKDRVRGRWLAVVSLVVAVVLIPTMLIAFWKEMDPNEISPWDPRRGPGITEPAPVPAGPAPRTIEVEGAENDLLAHEIRDAAWELWIQYIAVMYDHDLDLADARSLYPNDEWKELRAMHPDELRTQAMAGKLGMPLMGQDSLPVPPWRLGILKIEVGPWNRTAKLILQSSDPYVRVDAPMKRDDGRWAFDVAPVKIETDDDLPIVKVPDDD